MDLKLRYYGDSILRKRAQEVEVFDEALAQLAAGMVEIMHRANGIGLAAPQVGVSRRVIVALEMRDTEDVDVEPVVMVNPEILGRSSDTWVLEEGCLSIPGVNGDVTRATGVRVGYRDVNGGEHTVDANGMFARILLHEIDHLDGRLFIDYLSPARKSLIKPALRAIAEGNV